MSSDLQATLKASLKEFIEPHYASDLDSAGALREISADGKRVQIELGFPADDYAPGLQQTLEAWLAERGHEAAVEVSWKVREHAVQGSMKPLAGIRNIIAVASGKGGVGKSTTAANLALALAADGAKVGMLDADIYGPSQPRMLGMSGKPVSHDGKTMEPMENHGIKCMSIGFLVDEDQPMVWRGPMVTQALTQLLNETRWGELDYLIVDMPPGTGDTQLTMSQRVPLAGAVIVTTPQDIALLDARKGLQMFRKVSVNVLGIVENMSTHICSNCGHEEHIFGAEGGRRMAEKYSTPFLGALPLDIRIREETDSGEPTVISAAESEIAAKYREIARNMSARLAAASSAAGATAFPNITEDDS